MRLLTALILLITTLSSGFGQLVVHACDDKGIYFAQSDCGGEEACCSEGNHAMDTDDHCVTRFVYFLTAKYKILLPKIGNKLYLIFLKPTINQKLIATSIPLVAFKNISQQLKPPIYRHNRLFTGVFTI